MRISGFSGITPSPTSFSGGAQQLSSPAFGGGADSFVSSAQAKAVGQEVGGLLGLIQRNIRDLFSTFGK